MHMDSFFLFHFRAPEGTEPYVARMLLQHLLLLLVLYVSPPLQKHLPRP
jgi:hypothetical protein